MERKAPRAIVLTSGKGGVGKSTLAVCLGRALAERGRRVVLVDADLGLNNLDVLLDVSSRVVYDLSDVVENRCRVRQALVEDPESKGRLFVLPSVRGYGRGAIDAQSLKAVVGSLKQLSDFVLIDCPAGIELGFHRAVGAADEALIVTTPHLSALRDASKVAGLLKSYRLNSVTAVLNRVRGDMEYYGEAAGSGEAEEILGVKLSGCVPDDDGLNLLSSTAEPAAKGEGTGAIAMLAGVLTGEDERIYDAGKRYRGVVGSLRRRIRRII